MTDCQVRLHRDALNTPWGFRLQGGKDFNAPLTIQRVFAGSPAEGEVHRGDIILAIDNYDATQMTHKNAQDLIKKGGGSLSLRIRRSAKVGPEFFAAPQSPTAGVRPQSFAPAPQPRPTNMSGGFQGYGVDYNRPHAPQHRPVQVHFGSPVNNYGNDNMLSRVNQTLSEVVWQPHQQNYQQPGDDDVYEQKSIAQLKHQFSSPANSSHVRQDDLDEHEEPHRSVRELTTTYQAPGPVHRVPRSSGHRAPGRWQKPPPDVTGVPSGLREPGWSPGKNSPRKVSAPPTYTPQSFQQDHVDHRPVNQPPSKPAWAGTLRSSGPAKAWEIQDGHNMTGAPEPAPAPVYNRQPSGGYMNHSEPEPVVPHQPKVQNVHYGPGSGPVYEQHAPDQHNSDTAQVTHSQYNTPIGLYSQQNVQAALDAQTTGKPGQGTLQVTSTGPDGKKAFNPAQSDVYRLLMEEEGNKKPRGHGLPQHQQQQQQSARYADQNPGQEMQYHGYQDHSVQSRSMQNLEYNMNHQSEEYGTSDF